MLNVVKLNVIKLNFVMLNVIMFNVLMLNALMLNVMTSRKQLVILDLYHMLFQDFQFAHFSQKCFFCFVFKMECTQCTLPESNGIKLFTATINKWSLKARMLVPGRALKSWQMLASKANINNRSKSLSYNRIWTWTMFSDRYISKLIGLITLQLVHKHVSFFWYKLVLQTPIL